MGIQEFKANKKNPFVEDTLIHLEKGYKTIKVGDSDSIIINRTTSEIESDSAIFLKRIPIDKTQFSKLYVNNLSSFFELGQAGKMVFLFFAKMLKPNNDKVFFDYEDCMEFTKYKSKKTIANGLSELLENKIIARSNKPYFYYINPSIFFNGDRITWVKQYVKVDKKNDGRINKDSIERIE